MAENILSSSAGTLHTADCLVPMSRADSMRNTSPAWAAVCTQRFVGSRTPWHDSTCGEGQRILLVCTSQQQMHAPRGVRPGGCRIGRRKLAGYLHPRGLRTLARYPYPSHEVRRVGSYRQAVSHYLSHREERAVLVVRRIPPPVSLWPSLSSMCLSARENGVRTGIGCVPGVLGTRQKTAGSCIPMRKSPDPPDTLKVN